MTQDKKRLLITGATGFIGGHILRQALEDDSLEVWVAVRPSTNISRLEGLPIRVVEMNYADEEGLVAIVRQYSREHEPAWHYVIHNAGLTKTARPSEFREANAENTRRLFAALASAEHLPEHVVLMSSMSTYHTPSSMEEIIVETTPQKPRSLYGQSKLLAEQYAKASPLPCTILQPTGVYGPGDEDYLIAIRSIKRGLNAMAGLVSQRLTFVHGADVARAALFVLRKPEAIGRSFIVSDGTECTDIQFGHLVQGLLGRRRVLHLRMPLPLVRLVCILGSIVGRITGRATPLNRDKYHILAQRNWRCSSLALQLLGFSPKYDLSRGMQETIEHGIKG